MDKKECNTVLQKKLSKVTNVIPKDQEKIDDESDKEDIVDTVRPFFTLLQFLGLQQMTFNGHEITQTSGWLKLYSLLIASAIFGTQLTLLIMFYTKPSEPQSPSTVVTELLKIIPPTLSAIVCMFLSSTSYQEIIIRVLNNFKITDRQLDIQSKNIYLPLRNKVMAVVSLITIGTIAMYVCDYLYFNNSNQMYMTGLVMFINDYVLMEVCLLLFIVKTRLDVLNTQLNATKYESSKIFNKELSIISKKKDLITMSMGATNFKESSAKKMLEDERADDLIRLMKVYDRLADNANIVNSCFGIPLLSAAVTTFMIILSTVSTLIAKKKQNDAISDYLENANVSVWCLRNIMVVVIVTIVIEIMMSSVKKTSNIINKLSICPNIDPAREELLDRFSQLITCRKFTITACNFFPFDFTFIYSLVGSVATYTVILLQVNPGTPTPKT